MLKDIKIDCASIPDYEKDSLAAATLELVRGILRQPDGRKRLDRKKREIEMKLEANTHKL